MIDESLHPYDILTTPSTKRGTIRANADLWAHDLWHHDIGYSTPEKSAIGNDLKKLSAPLMQVMETLNIEDRKMAELMYFLISHEPDLFPSGYDARLFWKTFPFEVSRSDSINVVTHKFLPTDIRSSPTYIRQDYLKEYAFQFSQMAMDILEVELYTVYTRH